MKLLVIGNTVVDTIDFNGEIAVKPGGIFYTITALNNFKEKQDKISLVTAIDKKHYLLFENEYKKLDEKIFENVESVPKVWLKVEKHSERHEKYENINQNLSFNIKDLNLYDGILINMITGFDIALKQLKEIRKNYNGIIYFDVHTFSRGLDKDFKRNFRAIPGFNEWAENLDIVQVNKSELLTLSEKKNEEEIIKEVLSYGIKYLIVTLEEKGAKIFFKENDEVKSIYQPAIKVDINNKIGCGDVFGAVFFYSYISQGFKNIDNALRLANIAAGCTASYKEFDEFINLKKDVLSRYN
jgi:sugar/nucleoside kinase (ribokinase family)